MNDLLQLWIPVKPEFIVGGEGYSYLRADKARDDGVVGDVIPHKLMNAGLKLQSRNVYKDDNGLWHCDDLGTCFETLPSSHTGIAMKLFSGPRFYPFLSLKASPAKILQGHNVFGPVSIRSGAMEMLGSLTAANPELCELLDFSSIEVMRIDCTFSARLPSEKLVMDTLEHLRKVSVGQTISRIKNKRSKKRISYDSTVYWGSEKSRLRILKAYAKLAEFMTQLADLEKQAKRGDALATKLVKIMSDQRLQDWSNGLLRLEASIMSRWLERRNLPLNLWALIRHQDTLRSQGRCFITELWQESTAELRTAFEGHTMKIVDDSHVRDALRAKFCTVTKLGNTSYAKADRIFAFYERLCDRGFDYLQTVTDRATMWRYLKDLKAIGLSDSYLQNIAPEHAASNVVPLLRLLHVDLSQQLPPWYVEPVSAFDNQLGRMAA